MLRLAGLSFTQGLMTYIRVLKVTDPEHHGKVPAIVLDPLLHPDVRLLLSSVTLPSPTTVLTLTSEGRHKGLDTILTDLRR